MPHRIHTENHVRRRLEIGGRVQGVGFRPYIYRLATDMQLSGHVGNSPGGAFIEIEGSPPDLDRFTDRIHDERPPLVNITSCVATELAVNGDRNFTIQISTQGEPQSAEITPDTTLCDDCRREMFDPTDRRYGYPFINCTNCGPRYSIIQGVPYDRAATTMSSFTMCPACQTEYDDPANRRFHAQPNACADCGPRVWLTAADGIELSGDPIIEAAGLLMDGKILAIKGLGGFHLACRADSDRVVGELRTRKSRESKPLAVMVPDVPVAAKHAHLDEFALNALLGTAHPIVLGLKKPGSDISTIVAPGTHTLGVMLPYTPLHELLLAAVGFPLVMTSGNPSSEPLCAENSEALQRLAHIADYWLLHDRDIERRVDDSVVATVKLSADDSRLFPLRRARGYAPAPIALEIASPAPILALGGELKSTVCLLSGEQALISEHLGDLDNPAAYRNFIGTIKAFGDLFDITPRLLACDLHPDYAATRHARELGLPVTEVQHHHAHIVSCMADNGITGQVIGIACDGTGLGTDGAIWGCEVMVCDEVDFERVGHLANFPLPGGDAAARDTWRPAVGLLHETFGRRWPQAVETAFAGVDPQALTMYRDRLQSAVPVGVQTSSLGRLFDAVAFLLGVCDRNRSEAEAPMALEALAAAAATDAAPAIPTDLGAGACGGAEHSPAPLAWELLTEQNCLVFDYRPLIREIIEGLAGGRSHAQMALAFHETVARALAEIALRTGTERGLDRVVLSGGSFANRILLRRLWALLREGGRQVYIHHRVPPGDGGLALGQAVIAAARLERGSVSLDD